MALFKLKLINSKKRPTAGKARVVLSAAKSQPEGNVKIFKIRFLVFFLLYMVIVGSSNCFKFEYLQYRTLKQSRFSFSIKKIY